MSRKKRKPRNDAVESSEAENTQPAAVEAREAADATALAPPPEAELEALRKEVEELREKNLRLLAESRNFQQRALRDKEEAIKYAEADFARALLVVIDDLERTLESAATATNVAAVADGVRIIHEHFLKVLRDRHIEPIAAEGKAFDPSYHEALMQQPSDTHPAGTVIQEMARGYKMHDRVLRSARVVVSSGPAQVDRAEREAEKEQ